jgi:hypothetical protein
MTLLESGKKYMMRLSCGKQVTGGMPLKDVSCLLPLLLSDSWSKLVNILVLQVLLPCCFLSPQIQSLYVSLMP